MARTSSTLNDERLEPVFTDASHQHTETYRSQLAVTDLRIPRSAPPHNWPARSRCLGCNAGGVDTMIFMVAALSVKAGLCRYDKEEVELRRNGTRGGRSTVS